MTEQAAPRIAVLGLFHETNTFSPIPTGLPAFEDRWYERERVFSEFDGTRTVIGGFLDAAAVTGMVPVPVFGAFATPAGPVTEEAFGAIRAAIARCSADAGAVDGVFVELHGDLFVDGHEDAESEILDDVRQLFPGLPIAVVLDLHANLAEPRLQQADILIGYRTNPHVDTWERGGEAARLLGDMLAGRLDPYRAHSGVPIIAVPSAQQTEAEPLRTLIALAAELETDYRLEDVSTHAGYAYGDSRFTGIGFSATADRGQAASADAAVELLRAKAIELRDGFVSDFPTPEAAVAQAIASEGTVAIADIGDNINGGSPGDATWLAHLALQHPAWRVLMSIADADALAIAREAGVGARVRLSLGGAASPRSGEPLVGMVEVLALGDGVFCNEGPMAGGVRVDMKGVALVRLANLDIVIQGVPVQPNDSNMFRSLGLRIEDYDAVLLKGASALRADWASRVAGILDAATPGETDPVLTRLDYRRARIGANGIHAQSGESTRGRPADGKL